MNVHNPALAKQHEASKQIRDRLMNGNDWVRRKDVDAARAELEQERLLRIAAEAEATNAAGRLMQSRKRIEALELDMADLHARLLSQAERICHLENVGMTETPGKKPVADIVAEVLADYPGVTWKEICGIRRIRTLIEPRHKCMYEVSRQRPDLSMPAIGRIFGGRDHTTIYHAVRKYQEASQ